MNMIATKIAGCYRVEVKLIGDARGYFTRVFDLGTLREKDPNFTLLQVNRSLTAAQGAIRGLHFQKAPRPVRVLQLSNAACKSPSEWVDAEAILRRYRNGLIVVG